MGLSHIHDGILARYTRAITVVGCGRSARLCRDLARTGVKRFTLIDPASVGAENIVRRDYRTDQLGMPKVEALAAELRRVNRQVEVRPFAKDFCELTFYGIGNELYDSDVLVFATDNPEAQAYGNVACLLLDKPAVWVGTTPVGGGEVFFWKKGLPACYRCMLLGRNAAEKQPAQQRRDEASSGLQITLLNDLAGIIVLGLLTETSPGYCANLIHRLGDRQLLHATAYAHCGVARRDSGLGEPTQNDVARFDVLTIACARPAPDPHPDCTHYLGQYGGLLDIPDPAWPCPSRWSRAECARSGEAFPRTSSESWRNAT